VSAGMMGPIIISDFKVKESFYAGLGIGGNFNNDNEQVSSLTNQNQTSSSANFGQLVGNLYIGYGHTWNNKYFLGVEANTYFPGHTLNITTAGVSNEGVGNFYTNQYTFKDYLGLDLLPGLRFHPNSLIYGRTGLAFRDIQVSQYTTINPASQDFFNAGHSIGGRFGAGIAHGFNENIGITIEYFYTYYPTWGSYWSTYSLQYNMKSHQNYIGISLVFTS
jgi:hypothetical protein